MRTPALRTSSATAVAAAVALLASSCMQSSGEGGEDTIVLGVETNPGDPLADMLNFFGDELEAELGDQIEVERYLGGAIGDETALLEALRAGEVDSVVVGSDIATLEPMFNVLEVPFLLESRENATEYFDGEFGEELSDQLVESQNIRVLSYGENGLRHITNNERPIHTPEDLEGLRLRVPGVDARVDTFSDLGAVPTPVDIDELYLSLDQGVVDGQENPLVVNEAFSLYEQQQYLSLSSHIYSPAILTIGEDSWQALTAEQQEAFETAAQTAAELSRDSGEEADKRLVSEFEGHGMEVNEIDMEAFRTAVEPVWERMDEDLDSDFIGRSINELTED